MSREAVFYKKQMVFISYFDINIKNNKKTTIIYYNSYN